MFSRFGRAVVFSKGETLRPAAQLTAAIQRCVRSAPRGDGAEAAAAAAAADAFCLPVFFVGFFFLFHPNLCLISNGFWKSALLLFGYLFICVLLSAARC